MAHKEYVRKYGGGNSREREEARGRVHEIPQNCVSRPVRPCVSAMLLPSQLWPL